MRLTALVLSILVSAGSVEAAPDSGKAASISSAAALPAKIIAAIDAAQVQRSGRLELLYGLLINGADTDGGRLVLLAETKRGGAPTNWRGNRSATAPTACFEAASATGDN